MTETSLLNSVQQKLQNACVTYKSLTNTLIKLGYQMLKDDPDTWKFFDCLDAVMNVIEQMEKFIDGESSPNESLMDVMEELIRRRIVEKPFKIIKNDDDYVEQDLLLHQTPSFHSTPKSPRNSLLPQFDHLFSGGYEIFTDNTEGDLHMENYSSFDESVKTLPKKKLDFDDIHTDEDFSAGMREEIPRKKKLDWDDIHTDDDFTAEMEEDIWPSWTKNVNIKETVAYQTEALARVTNLFNDEEIFNAHEMFPGSSIKRFDDTMWK